MFKVYNSRDLLLSGLLVLGGCTGGGDQSSSRDGSSSESSSIPISSNSTTTTSSSLPTLSSSSQSSEQSSSVAQVSSQAQSSVASGNDHPGKVLYNRPNVEGGCVNCHGANANGAGGQFPTIDLNVSFGAGATKPFVSYTATAMPFGADFSTCDLACAESIKSWLVDELGFADESGVTISSSVTTSISSSASSLPNYDEDVRFVSMLAINVGGGEFKSREDIQFKADEGSAGGDTSNQADIVGDITSTDDDTLFHTERWGQFTYSFDVPNGLYAVEFGFIELVQEHKAGSRVFNISIEGEVELQGIDVVKETGAHHMPLTREVEHIEVVDGAIDIDFQPTAHNATVSFINLKRVEETPDKYQRMCGSCHGKPDGSGRSELGDALVSGRCVSCDLGLSALTSFISQRMPFALAEACVGQCAEEMARYILDNFAGYNGNPAVQLDDFLDRRGDVGICSQPSVAFNDLRRVTSYDYNRMVADLLGVSGDFTKGFSSDQLVGNFFINTDRVPEINQVLQYFKVAETVSDEAMKNKTAWMPCSQSTDSCAEQTVETLGLKAFRRPLTSQEVSEIMEVYTKAKQAEMAASTAAESFDRGLINAVRTILVSPNFLYYVEKGEGNGPVVPLTQYEIAARLALFLWRGLPDNILLDAAKAGRLSTEAQLKAQAERMLQNDRAKDVITLFHKEWMHLEEPKEGQEGFKAQKAAFDGFEKTVESLVFNDSASYSDLFTVDYDYLNADSKALYDISSSPVPGESIDGLDRYIVDDRRVGILSRAPFLHSNHSPTTRGLFLRTEVFCGVIPQAPPTAAEEEQPADITLNPRQSFARHTTDPGCAGCHALMDPLGFPLDNFDEFGRWRENYGFKDAFPVDSSGRFVLTDITKSAFNGPTEMQEGIAGSKDVQTCYTYKWFEFAVGRRAESEDNCSLGQVNQGAYTSGSGSILEIISSIVTSDAFRNRRTAP